MTRAKAEDLARRHPAAAIAEKLEIFDWKLARDPSGMKRNPAGWLVKAVEDDYPAPRSFEGRAAREARLELEREAADSTRRAKAEARRRDRADRAVDESIARLDAGQKAALEAEALAGAAEDVRRDLDAPGLAPSIRKAFLLALVRDHAAVKLARRDSAPTLF